MDHQTTRDAMTLEERIARNPWRLPALEAEILPVLNLEAGDMRASIPLGEVPITFDVTSLGENTTLTVVIGTKESGE